MGKLTNKQLLYSIATEIKKTRLDNGVTLQKFFMDTGIHLARIEQGKSNITVSTLNTICAYFNITLISFFKNLEE